MKNGRNNASLGLPSGDASSEGPRIDLAPTEIDITKDRLGEILAARRHQLGLRIEEIAEDIKIRPDYLRAIEQEAFDKLPTLEYGRLFLKSYAERLGLNINDIYALYDVHHRPAWEPPSKARTSGAEHGMPIGPTPRMPAAKPIPAKVWIYLLIALVALAIVIIGILRLTKTSDGSPVDSRISTPPQRAAAEPATQTQDPQPIASALPDPATAADEIVIDAEMQLVLTFDRDTWVKLVADNDTIASGIFGPGRTLSAKGLDRFTISLGHTEGVRAEVNGRRLRPFSTRAASLAGLVMTADSVVAWMETEQP
jgi:cytoskeletal protein RodZ